MITTENNGKKMLFFIMAMRTLAACLITNSHYSGIYPIDVMASGGMVGDVIFFAVSGYCLYNVKGSFPKWYGKRFLRCYTPVILITAVYMLIGYYSLDYHSVAWWYLYPTQYHFIASIMILYIPFYVIMKVQYFERRIPLVMALIAVVFLLIYLFAYDTSYYHIDVVEEPMIRFLFIESMLLGAYLRHSEDKLRNNIHWTNVAMTVVLFVLYFVSKFLFVRFAELAPFQILNQILVFVFLYYVFRLFIGLDDKLERLPKWCKTVVVFISKITLEIYVVQNYIIGVLRNVSPFPINWLCVTGAILIAAFVLHFVSDLLIKGAERVAGKLSANKV